MKISKVLLKYNTDKNKKVEGLRPWHSYGKAYDHLFKKFKYDAKLDLIEIGTYYGESLLAWREYFPNANISGVDIVDLVENKRKDIEYIISDIKDFKPTKKYDIVIDDGSHKLNDAVHTVRNIKLKVGGIMIIEDCHEPLRWLGKIRNMTKRKYSIEAIDLRWIKKRQDDFLIVLRNYGYYQ